MKARKNNVHLIKQLAGRLHGIKCTLFSSFYFVKCICFYFSVRKISVSHFLEIVRFNFKWNGNINITSIFNIIFFGWAHNQYFAVCHGCLWYGVSRGQEKAAPERSAILLMAPQSDRFFQFLAGMSGGQRRKNKERTKNVANAREWELRRPAAAQKPRSQPRWKKTPPPSALDSALAMQIVAFFWILPPLSLLSSSLSHSTPNFRRMACKMRFSECSDLIGVPPASWKFLW